MNFTTSDYLAMLARTKGVTPVSKSEERESQLHSHIIAECRHRGWIALHGSMAHRAMRTPGEWDFTVLADDGRIFLVEAKTRTGKLSSDQLAIHAWARKLGHVVHVVRSLEEFLAVTK